MTCCIVAALIISQLLAYRDRIKRLLGFKMDDDAGRDPLLPPGLGRTLRRVALPLLALCATVALGFEHRAHLAQWIAPVAHVAAAPPTSEICTNVPRRRP